MATRVMLDNLGASEVAVKDNRGRSRWSFVLDSMRCAHAGGASCALDQLVRPFSLFADSHIETGPASRSGSGSSQIVPPSASIDG
jgi:hypothetical protein